MDCLRVDLGEVAKVGGFCDSTAAEVRTLNGAGFDRTLVNSPRLLQPSFLEEFRSGLLGPRIVRFDGMNFKHC
jgi:hypothetical protein